MLLSEGAICGSKKSRFLKEQEAKGLISNLDLKTPLSKIPLSQIFHYGFALTFLKLILFEPVTILPL